MSSFWEIWVAFFTILFFILMLYVVINFWKKNNTADKNKILEEFDGIQEADAPAPKILFIGYVVLFSVALVRIILYPGLSGFEGLLGWQQNDDAVEHFEYSLQQQIDNNSGSDLLSLANNPEIVQSGGSLFKVHCASCHGQDLQGQEDFPNLLDDDWLYGDSDEEIIHSITAGRYGAMAGWEDQLPAEDIEDVAYFIASLSGRPLSSPEVQIESGKRIYDLHCISCHGEDYKGSQVSGAANLSDSIWLHGGSIEAIQHTITKGIGNVMPAFGKQLQSAEIRSIAAYIIHTKKVQDDHLASLDSDKVKLGEYLAYAGDCVACHTAEGGEPFAGGLPFVTPFGTVYSTNITPHKERGMGDYNYQEFKDVLYKGKGKHGYLYPAMPYTSYQYLTEEDAEALWLYLQTITAVAQRNRENSMMFPANVRLGLLAWNIVFMDTDPLTYDGFKQSPKTESVDQAVWKRGKYLAASFGHCSECHTPRNIAQALDEERIYQGNIIDGWNAPNISAQELYVDGWDIDQLTTFLYTGHSNKGSAFAGMAEVVKNSLSHISEDDVRAISSYLIAGDVHNRVANDAQVIYPKGFDETAKADKQYKVFEQTCGACHAEDGKGRESIAPTLLNNGIIMHRDPYNTIAVTIRGLNPSYLNAEKNFMSMVSFKGVLDDQELADLINFVRKNLGGRDEPVTMDMVKDIRLNLQSAGYAENHHKLPEPSEFKPE